ncbi:zinc finger protein 112-like isoform X3 [Ornithodoros turicata]
MGRPKIVKTSEQVAAAQAKRRERDRERKRLARQKSAVRANQAGAGHARRRDDETVRAAEAAAKREKRQDPTVRAAEAEARRRRRQDPAVRAAEAAAKRRQRQDPAVRATQAEAKRRERLLKAEGATKAFKCMSLDNSFGFGCSVCDRLCCRNDLCPIPAASHFVLQEAFPGEDLSTFRVCATCRQSLRDSKVPSLSTSSGYRYPLKPAGMSPLNLAHFEADQFESKRQDGWRKLKPNAVPTIFRQMGSKKRPPSKARKRTKVAKSAMMRHQLRRQADALARQQDDDVRQVLVEAMLIEAPSTSSCTSQFATDTSMASVYPLNIKQEPENCSLSCSPRNVAENEEFISPDPPETAAHSINIKQEPQDEFPSSPTNYEETSEYCVETPEVTIYDGVNIKEELVDFCEPSASSQCSTVGSGVFVDHKPMVTSGNLLTAVTSDHCHGSSMQLLEHNEEAKALGEPSHHVNYKEQEQEQAFQYGTHPATSHDISLLKDRHLNVHNTEVFRCDICDAVCYDPFSLREHIKLHTGGGSRNCETSPSMFAEKASPMSRLHAHNGGEGPRTSSSESSHRCHQCPAAFRDLHSLGKHMRAHVGKPYKCEQCPASCDDPRTLLHHMKAHGEVKPYRCVLCPASFAALSNLKRHMSSVHTKERPYHCELCPATFAERSMLRRHQLTHTGEKNFQCELCPASFAEAHKLKRHMMTHTGERPYKCQRCPAAFSQHCHLKNHACAQEGGKPYKCTVCPATFNVLRNLEAHMRIHNGAELHKCELCPAKFAYLHYLHWHMHSHGDKKTFKCSSCPAAFKHYTNLERHVRNHACERTDECAVSAPTLTEPQALECHVKTDTDEGKLG